MDHLFADAAATSVGRMRTHLQVFVAEHAPDAQDLQALRSIRAYQKIVVHKGILVRRGPWRRSVRGKLAFFAECVHALFLDDCPISSFVRTSETLLYVGTGNAEPWPSALRTKDVSTGRDNLYVASIVAVNVDTGAYKWHYQMVPGDEWDYDSVQQMILADLNINGKS